MNMEIKYPTMPAETVFYLEDEISDLIIGCEKANLMIQDLLNSFFWKNSKSAYINERERETLIAHAFDDNRIRAEILLDILNDVQCAAKALDRKVNIQATDQKVEVSP